MSDVEEKYTAKSIEVLEGLDPVRRRPGMYTDTTRPNHLAQEVIDNSVDEAISGFAKKIDVTLHEDSSITVVDDGRGMPVDKHPVEKKPGVEVILTKLHAGAKFRADSYEYSGGLHGVGISVVNALSERVEVRIRRASKEYEITFAGGKVENKLKTIGTVGARNTGTTIRFWPDTQYFDSAKISVPRLKHVLRAKAVLCAGLRVRFKNEATGEKITWEYADGVLDYLKGELGNAYRLPDVPLSESVDGEGFSVQWAICWVPEGELVTESYVNLIPTIQGGTHVNGLRGGLVKALRAFIDLHDLMKGKKKLKLATEDIWERVSYLLSIKVTESYARFSGQTKERLTSREVAPLVAKAAEERFALWLNTHVEMGKQLADFAIARAEARAAKGAKVKRKRAVQGPMLPGKLTDCTASDRTITELFLVEGDSAGGSCKKARDKEFQAVLPLRGKVLNTWEATVTKALSNQEVSDMSVAIGVEPGSADLSNLRYGKVCILADADSDGHHIATLLCALFLRHFRPLVAKGHVYVALPPLFRIDLGRDQPRYVLSEEERDAVIREHAKGRKPTILRFKGLGEMNASQLRESTIDPTTRTLQRLVLDDESATEAMVDMLLAKKRASDRRSWLEASGDLADLGVMTVSAEEAGPDEVGADSAEEVEA